MPSGAAAAYFNTAADATEYAAGRPKVRPSPGPQRSLASPRRCTGYVVAMLGLTPHAQYPSELFEAVLEQHGDNRGTLLDLGCGPGIVGASAVDWAANHWPGSDRSAVNELAHLFETAIGIDTSEPFIAAARARSTARTRSDQPLRFDVGSAESMPVDDASVDLLVCGIAVHWFDPAWWSEAERVVRPGGTVALFTYRGDYLEWGTQHAELWRSPDGLVYHDMRAWHDPSWPAFEPGNRYVRSLYDELPMPSSSGKWSAPMRRKWDVDGKPTDPERGFLCSSRLTLRQLVKRYETYSLVAKWRADHPKVAHGPDDALLAAVRRIKNATGWSDDAPTLVLGSALVLVTLKRL